MRIFWFVCIFLYFLCFIFFVCFLFRVVVAVSPLCYMLRRFWAPTPDLASESDQLYSHVHSQSYIPIYVHSQSRWRVYNLTIVFSCTSSISLKSVGTSTISIVSTSSEKCLVKNLCLQSRPKIWFQNVFSIDWNTVLRPSRVFRRVLPRAKRPRIEALKLQMCVMVISPLFAVILMTDLILVFKRPTETQQRQQHAFWKIVN